MKQKNGEKNKKKTLVRLWWWEPRMKTKGIVDEVENDSEKGIQLEEMNLCNALRHCMKLERGLSDVR